MELATIQECTGCGVCESICSHHAIRMAEDKEGFLRPIVNPDVCVNCGLCIKRCPILNMPEKHMSITAFAAKCKDKELLQSSNSGGVFSAMALYVLTNLNGVVCGATLNSDMTVEHQIVERAEDLHVLQGSKYVQSKANSIFPDVKIFLQTGRTVLFCGTGCQIGGLYSYLHKDYNNLITMELVCHGVPSPGLFRKYLSWLGNRHHSTITKFQFRFKEKGSSGGHGRYRYTANGKTYVGNAFESPYYDPFLEGRNLRLSCSHCNFKGKERIGDFTVGDFWGIERYIPQFDSKFGVCMLLVNTGKAQEILADVAIALDLKETSFESVASSNPSLFHSAPIRDMTWNLNDKDLFSKIFRPNFTLKKWIKVRIPEDIKRVVKRYI